MLKVQLSRDARDYVIVETLAEASRAVNNYIDRNFVGSSKWYGGKVTDLHYGTYVATVSYNGRVWGQLGDYGSEITGEALTKSYR